MIRPFVIAVLLDRAHRPCFRVAVAHDMIGGANSYARVWPCRSCLIVIVLSSRIRFSSCLLFPIVWSSRLHKLAQMTVSKYSTSLLQLVYLCFVLFRLHLVIVLLVWVLPLFCRNYVITLQICKCLRNCNVETSIEAIEAIS